MADATKTARTFQSSTSNSAGDTTTGSAVNLTTALGVGIIAKITNGASGPSTGCVVTVQVSNDNTNWFDFASARAGTANNESYTFVFDIPDWVMHARTVFSGNTGQAVTVEAHGHELTSVE